MGISPSLKIRCCILYTMHNKAKQRAIYIYMKTESNIYIYIYDDMQIKNMYLKNGVTSPLWLRWRRICVWLAWIWSMLALTRSNESYTFAMAFHYRGCSFENLRCEAMNKLRSLIPSSELWMCYYSNTYPTQSFTFTYVTRFIRIFCC